MPQSTSPKPSDSNDAAVLLASYRKNRPLVLRALEHEGLPSDWLAAWDAPLARLAGDAPLSDCPAKDEHPASTFRRATFSYAAALNRQGLPARTRAYELVMAAKEVIFRAQEEAVDRHHPDPATDLRALGINALTKLRGLCERFDHLYRRGTY